MNDFEKQIEASRKVSKEKLLLRGRQHRLNKMSKMGGNIFLDTFNKVKNEFVNPDSKLRQTIQPTQPKKENDPNEPTEKQYNMLASASYSDNKPVEGFTLIKQIPTVSAYKKNDSNVIVISARGTKDLNDVKTDLNLVINNLVNTNAYKTVKRFVSEIVKKYSNNNIIYITGHSLGGQVAIQLARDFPVIKAGLTFNPAYETKDFLNRTASNVRRKYTQNDPLGKLGRYLPGSEVEDKRNLVEKILPSENVRTLIEGHNLSSFESGRGRRKKGGMDREQKELEEYVKKYKEESEKEFAKMYAENPEDNTDLINAIKTVYGVEITDSMIPIINSFLNTLKDSIRLDVLVSFVLKHFNVPYNFNDYQRVFEALGLTPPKSVGIIPFYTKYNGQVEELKQALKPAKPIVIALGKPKRGRPKKDVVSMPKKEYIKEHKRLIKVLQDAGKEGERQKQEVEHRRIGGMVLQLMEMDRQHKMGGNKAMVKIIKGHAKMIADEITAYNKKFGGNWFTDTFNKVKNEFVNPDSVFRQAVVKPIENVAQKIGNEFTNPSSIFRSQVLAPVERSFEKFGRDTKEAFEDIGNKIKNEFTNSDSELARAFKPLTDTIGNEDWWKKTMTTPDTYILLITIALDVANMAGVPGAGLASQATKMIGDLAQGRKVSVADLANLALAMIPTPKVPGSQGIFNQIKSQVVGNAGMSAVARSQLIGRNIVKVGKELAGDAKVGFGEMTENGKNYKLHAIVINKKNFDKNDAVVEASKYGSKKGMFMRETKQSFRFRNIPKTKFIPKSYRTKKIGKNGVSLIYGELK
jgi:dienelactone hydrolase